jgi:hypothetical protein
MSSLAFHLLASFWMSKYTLYARAVLFGELNCYCITLATRKKVFFWRYLLLLFCICLA